MSRTKSKSILSAGVLVGARAVAYIETLSKALATAKSNGKDALDKLTVGSLTGEGLSEYAGETWNARPVGSSVGVMASDLLDHDIAGDAKPCEPLDLVLGDFGNASNAIALLATFGKDKVESLLTGLKATDKDAFDSIRDYIATRTHSKLVWDKVE